jgi:hypothetical protein
MTFTSARSRKSILSYLMLALASCLALSGCLSPRMYLDPKLGDTKLEEITKPTTPKPAQLAFEFQTKGSGNARATERLKPQVQKLVASSGLFSDVSSTPIQGGGLLSVKIDNIVLTNDAASKGFVTGLTFGLAGSMVTDGYVCTFNYTPEAGAPISKTFNHALHTTIGNKEGPAGLTPFKTAQEAVDKMIEQIVMYGLKQISSDPAFKAK